MFCVYKQVQSEVPALLPGWVGCSAPALSSPPPPAKCSIRKTVTTSKGKKGEKEPRVHTSTAKTKNQTTAPNLSWDPFPPPLEPPNNLPKQPSYWTKP